MNAGNNLYSTLSQLSKDYFLLLTDLPGMVTIYETQYELQYSESYVGNLFGTCFPIEGFAYCTTLTGAFNLLLRQDFSCFILTIGCSTVAVFCLSGGRFKVFDSHSRDSFGMEHPEGKCVLIELRSVGNLLEYFQTLYVHLPAITFEIKGVNICLTEDRHNRHRCEEPTTVQQRSKAIICKCKQCCAISFYSICFSVIKSCSYWNSDTLSAVIEKGNTFYRKMNVDKHLVISDLPNKLEICAGTDVNVVFTAKRQGVLSKDKSLSKQNLHELITQNNRNNTGFLLPADKITCV